MKDEKCPCGSEKTYALCCKIAHDNPMFISTAEQLMRSRYTAFTKVMGEYLVQTHHSSTVHSVNQQELENWAKSVKWVKLEVLNSTSGQSNDETGTVEFKAHFKEGFRSSLIHENSFFEKEFGVWKYVTRID
jgi:SEC-C motif-containing protein